MKFAIIIFPGTSCEEDVLHAVQGAGHQAEYVWHSEASPTALDTYDAVILPGGASHGNYLRSGSMAAQANIIPALHKANEAGKPILGICNGFQILTEAGLLPGGFLPNESMRFICKPTEIKVENAATTFTNKYAQGQTITLPIAHAHGNYYADDTTLAELQANNQIIFTYNQNPNGSQKNIAGITNKAGNILGLMPHPERAVDKLLGSEDGLGLFKSIN
ncbi:MAG: phosphoribosylformylglycinamidine synthase subunit PurQ [Defluviitaleaceae bacterium]|nr:phosphoribosylformylglycinamidine synthase subunit PurQ [Defluviitaleaceae bacterium]